MSKEIGDIIKEEGEKFEIIDIEEYKNKNGANIKRIRKKKVKESE